MAAGLAARPASTARRDNVALDMGDSPATNVAGESTEGIGILPVPVRA